MLKLLFMFGFIKVISFRMIVTLLLRASYDDILKLKLTYCSVAIATEYVFATLHDDDTI